jgi:hypothetical protein
MRTLVASPFQDDAAEIIEWAYGEAARVEFYGHMNAFGQRAGQAFMNVLREFDAESYERISGSLWDPFYDDKRLGEAIDRLTSK